MLRTSVGALAGLIAATSLAWADHHEKGEAPAPPKEAVAVLIPTQGNEVTGVILLSQEGDMVRIHGEVRGLEPGSHGFHIHEFGDMRAPDGTSAGGHYDPKGHKHGGPDDEEHHAGDLGNIEANEQGVAKVDKQSKDFQLHFVLGRTIVVHAKADDLKSQPSGDAGPRVALGVIGFAEVKEMKKDAATPAEKATKKAKKAL